MTPESGEKVVQTFRIPRTLVAYLRKQAQDRGLDLTALVNRALDGLRTYYGLPTIAARLLDEDRRALKMDQLEYFLHVFYQRAELVKANKPGFEVPEDETPKSKR